jgi:glycosyltransferase involved in cell wall biosynthesis
MFKNKKVIVVMPAYNAVNTLHRTYDEVMDQGIVDLVIVVDDASDDETAALAETLPNTKVYSSAKSGIRRQSENLLQTGSGRGGRHYYYGSSRLSIHAETHSGHGIDDRE